MTALFFVGLLLAPSVTPTVEWPPARNAYRYRVFVCPENNCTVQMRQVGEELKPFPTNLSQWVLLADLPRSKRRFPAGCGYSYSVQSVAKSGRTSGGSNVVRCP
jgi:hypothetical protein